jgi:hypothetical protein
VDAAAVVEPRPTSWEVQLTLSGEALRAFSSAAVACFDRTPACPSGQLANVIDGLVVSTSEVLQREYQTANIVVSADFTEAQARDLASRFD